MRSPGAWLRKNSRFVDRGICGNAWISAHLVAGAFICLLLGKGGLSLWPAWSVSGGIAIIWEFIEFEYDDFTSKDWRKDPRGAFYDALADVLGWQLTGWAVLLAMWPGWGVA